MRALLAACVLSLAIGASSAASETSSQLTWMGRQWTITNGGIAGVAPGRLSNVYVDSNGYLHLLITRKGKGKKDTGAELLSNENLGFGTYQWEIQGHVDQMDPHTVLGLFPYGPDRGIGKEGVNEIDIEFSQWGGNLCGGACNADFTVYPALGHKRLGLTEDDFDVNLEGGELVTARLTWSSTSITETDMAGLQPLGTTQDVLHTWTFAPSEYLERIPQEPLPLAMNLWCFEKPAATNQAVIIRSFEYVPASASARRELATEGATRRTRARRPGPRRTGGG